MKRRTFLAAGGAAIVLGGWTLTRGGATGESLLPLVSAANAQETTGEAPAVNDMILGSADAPIEIIEYGSFTCPHCAAFHEGFFTPLKAEYIDTGKVRFVYRELVRNRPDIWASMLARCGDGLRYEGISGLLFTNQSEWVGSGDPATIVGELRKMGKVVGYSDEQIDACMSDNVLAQAILDTSNANSEADNVTGTPTVFIDGERVSLTTMDAMRTLLDAKIDG